MSCVGLAWGAPARAGEVSVYGLELEVSAERERLLIFADRPIEPQLLPVDDRTLMVALPGAVLDPSAPTQITPAAQGTVTGVTAFERAEGTREVRVVVQRRPGAPPRVERRASVVALDFEPMARAEPRSEQTIRIGYRNAPIASVVTDLARATGVSMVFDQAVSALGTVTIEGPPQASRAEALALIDSLLLLRGFAAIPSPGGARKIVPINGAPSPWKPSGRIPDTDAPITTMLRLETANAADLVPVITPYLGQNAIATAFAPTNSLIMSGPASLLRTLRTAIAALDQQLAGGPLIWPMRVARADTVADQVQVIAGELTVPYVSSDPRLNALMLRVRPGEEEHVREIVDRLDRPAHGAAQIQVVRLRYADPKTLAEQLLALRNDTGGAGPTADASAKRAGLRGLAFEVAPDAPTHSIVISGAPETIAAVLDVVGEVDRVPASVRVEVTVATVDLDDQLDLGMDFLIPSSSSPQPNDLIAAVLSNPSGGGAQSLFSRDRPIVAAYTAEPLLIPVFDPTTGLTVPVTITPGGTITMEGRTVKSDVLMQPRLLITSGEEHEIFSGDNVPIPVAAGSGGSTGTGITGGGTSGTGTGGLGTGSTGTGGTGSSSLGGSALGNAAMAGTTGGTTGTTGTTGAGTTGVANTSLTVQKNIERKDVGTSLRITPTLGEKGGVTLQLRVEVSALAESAVGPVERVGPSIRQTTVESTIRLRGNEIAVIATSGQPQLQRTETGIPWFKDIPVLGFAFRTTKDQTFKRHLLIAARAQILRPETRELADRLAHELAPPPLASHAER